jgi:hypothetical protein
MVTNRSDSGVRLSLPYVYLYQKHWLKTSNERTTKQVSKTPVALVISYPPCDFKLPSCNPFPDIFITDRQSKNIKGFNFRKSPQNFLENE